MSYILNRFVIFKNINNKVKKIIEKFYVYNDLLLYVTNDDNVFAFNAINNKTIKLEELCQQNINQFYIGHKFFFALNFSNDRLFGCGNNDYGQLGLGYISGADKILDITRVGFFENIIINQIYCHYNHTLVLTQNGSIYCWGDNCFGQIGCDFEHSVISTPTEIKFKLKIKSISCCAHSSFAITEDGRVYKWGFMGNKLLATCEPFLIYMLDNKVVNIGFEMKESTLPNLITYFLTNEGIIYSHNDMDDKLWQNYIKVTEMHSIHTITTVISGDQVFYLRELRPHRSRFKNFIEIYSIFGLTYKTIDIKNEILPTNTINVEDFEKLRDFLSLPKNKQIYYFGNDLNPKYIEDNGYTEKYIENMKYIYKIADNMLFISNLDQVFGCGSNKNGLIGLGYNEYTLNSTLISELCKKQIKYFYNGSDFGLSLNSKSNEIYGWGVNSRGQLGRRYTSDENIFLKPEIIKFPQEFRIEQICCGLYHTIVLTDMGELYVWGDNSHGQIGVRNRDSIVSTPTKIIQFIEIGITFNYIFCSDYSSFAITCDGIVYYWGLNNEQKDNTENVINLLVPQILKSEIIVKQIISMKTITENEVKIILTNEGILYYFDQNIFKPINIETKFKSLHYKKDYFYNICGSISIVVSNDDNIYILNGTELIKTNYKNVFYFYWNEFKSTLYAMDYKEYKSNTYKNSKYNGIKIQNKFQ